MTMPLMWQSIFLHLILKAYAALQTGSAFADLLQQLKQTQARLAEQYGHYVPLAVKIAPDLQDEDIEYIAEQLVHIK
jgi:dihydroorotate dehydrogenase